MWVGRWRVAGALQLLETMLLMGVLALRARLVRSLPKVAEALPAWQ